MRVRIIEAAAILAIALAALFLGGDKREPSASIETEIALDPLHAIGRLPQ